MWHIRQFGATQNLARPVSPRAGVLAESHYLIPYTSRSPDGDVLREKSRKLPGRQDGDRHAGVGRRGYAIFQPEFDAIGSVLRRDSLTVIWCIDAFVCLRSYGPVRPRCGAAISLLGSHRDSGAGTPD